MRVPRLGLGPRRPDLSPARRQHFAPPCIERQEIALRQVKVDTWAGFVYVNFDPDAGPLHEFLDPIPQRVEKFEIGKMRIMRQFTMVLP